MKRFFTKYLIDWKNRSHKKPMIVRGARQVGKTYIVEEFGKEHFIETIKINFEETPGLKQFFKTNDVEQTIQNLELYFGKKIQVSSTLLFLDEIQTCPEAIVSLRYFYEKIPQLHVIAAGSLLDHALNDLQYSMPVGRVEFAYMYPLSFSEFLNAIGEGFLVGFLKNYKITDKIGQPIHDKLIGLTRLYFFIGGMPEAVKVYAETKSLVDIERIHESIVKSLEFDFAKYGTRSQQITMAKLLKYIPKITGQKFKYVNFDNTIRSDAIRKSLDLLSMSRIINLVHNTKATETPLEYGVVEKVFKPLFLDIGLSNHILKLRLTDFENTGLMNEGSLAEQFVGQELLCMPPYFTENNIYYWVREQRNSAAEIDYAAQFANKILPIEVKAGKTGTLKSLQIFVTEKKLGKAIRFNADLPSSVQVDTSMKINNNLEKVNFQLISLPFYLVEEFERFL
ncbi:MAG: AAA family ATPase [Bacteroidetes bacterium]|nr:MAG: AAA family ATPase [Bacteroidota bacterium]